MKTYLLFFSLCTSLGYADEIETGRVADVLFTIPEGWTKVQHAVQGEVEFQVLENGPSSVRFYSTPNEVARLDDLFTKETSAVGTDEEIVSSGIKWKTAVRSRTLQNGREQTKYFTFAFLTRDADRTYYGFSRSTVEADAVQTGKTFLSNTFVPLRSTQMLMSLTDPDFTGKKYYLGFGVAGPRDPSFMHNEVTYDVKHTHAVFTSNQGGDYTSTTLFQNEASLTGIQQAWKDITERATDQDMVVQYSSGHGAVPGLIVSGPQMVLLSYDKIRDFALGLKAKEIVIFTMACHSGALVDSFNAKKSVWQDWKKQGRTLMVLASSRTSETSSSGPGTDPAEAAGERGTAGSAFGHALWKALSGVSDGFVDGTIDGFIDLGEIREYSRFRTRQLGGHVPVETGIYSANLIMNRVPSATFLSSMSDGSEGLSDDQLIQKIRQLDRVWRIESER